LTPVRQTARQTPAMLVDKAPNQTCVITAP